MKWELSYEKGWPLESAKLLPNCIERMWGLFFVAPWRLSATWEWSWTSFPATGCQKLIEVDDERKLHTLYEKVWPQKLLLTLWVKNGRVMWSKSVAGTISRVSPWSRVSWPMAEFACYWVSGIPVTDKGGMERESANLYWVALWMPIWVLNLVIMKKGEKDIPGLTDTTVSRRLGPKRASRIRKLFNLSKEDDVHNMLCCCRC